MLPAAPAVIIDNTTMYPILAPCLIRLDMYHIRKPMAMIRNILRKSLLPNSIPHAIPLFSTNSIWNQSKIWIDSPKFMLSLTATLIIWSITINSITNKVAVKLCFFFLLISDFYLPSLMLRSMLHEVPHVDAPWESALL